MSHCPEAEEKENDIHVQYMQNITLILFSHEQSEDSRWQTKNRDEYLINISRATDSKLLAFLMSATANQNIERIC